MFYIVFYIVLLILNRTIIGSLHISLYLAQESFSFIISDIQLLLFSSFSFNFVKLVMFILQFSFSWLVFEMGWRHFVDNDISWTLFFKMGDFSWKLSKGDFSWTLFGDFSWTLLSTRSSLFGWIFVDILWVNSSGHFLMVIINSANRRGCGGEAPATLSEHCSVPG
jgi:hypothetical protein